VPIDSVLQSRLRWFSKRCKGRSRSKSGRTSVCL